MISIHEKPALLAAARSQGIDPQEIELARRLFLRRGYSGGDTLGSLAPKTAGFLVDHCDFHSLILSHRRDSAIDGATRLVFTLDTGEKIETVLLRVATGRTAICLSSQAGCAAACVFCATGRSNRTRNLSTPEILDQLVQGSAQLGLEKRSLRNIVFMGMGEPFHNENAVHAALRELTAPRGFNFDARRILVSTVGIPEAMVRFARAFPRMGLALSLHAADQSLREQLVPVARRHRLDDLRAALVEVSAVQDQEVMIEYVLLRGLNDSPDHLESLARFLSGLRVHLNLIPCNPTPDAPQYSAPEKEVIDQFAAALKAKGFPVTVRYSLGADIGAACGQLAGETSVAPLPDDFLSSRSGST